MRLQRDRTALFFMARRARLDLPRQGSSAARRPHRPSELLAGHRPAHQVSLDEVAVELAKLPENRVPYRADWARLSSSWTRKIDERIAELERLRAGLTQCIGCGCLSLKQCQLANPADAAAGLGPGPRYLLGNSRRLKK